MSRFNYGGAGVLLLLASAFSLTACSINSSAVGPSDVVESFYAHQVPGAEPMPEDLFSNSDIQVHIQSLIAERTLTDGSFISQEKIGSNLMVNFGDQGREETVTFVFEVVSDSGRTRETVILRRGRKSEPYRIASYQIADAPQMKDSAPMGGSSA